MAEFIQPHASGIKNRDGNIGFGVIKLQETLRQVSVWYKRKIYIKSAERYLCLIPGLVQDISPEKLEIGNGHRNVLVQDNPNILDNDVRGLLLCRLRCGNGRHWDSCLTNEMGKQG